MILFNLGKLPGQQSMLIFHALARMGVESLVLVSPKVPLGSIGYFQDAEAEVDLEYCREAGIPVMRREVGGGTTFLDGNQIFYQVILKRDNPLAKRRIRDIYEIFSQPAIETYREFGIEVEFRPVNDLVTREGRKIAGEGSGDIGECLVFVGGILLDFDYRAMSRVIKVHEEKFRDKIYKTMGENLTTVRRELGHIPPRDEIKQILVEKFTRILGRVEQVEVNEELLRKMEEVERFLTSEAMLYKKTPRKPTGVKIREGVEVLYGIHKAPGGLIRTAQEVVEGRIEDIGISGDFAFYPKSNLDDLEIDLKRIPRKEKAIRDKVKEFYEEREVEVPGVEPEDFTEAIIKAE